MKSLCLNLVVFKGLQEFQNEDEVVVEISDMSDTYYATHALELQDKGGSCIDVKVSVIRCRKFLFCYKYKIYFYFENEVVVCEQTFHARWFVQKMGAFNGKTGKFVKSELFCFAYIVDEK